MKKAFLILVFSMLFFASCKNEGENVVTEKYQSVINNNAIADELISKSVDISEFGRLNLPYRLQGSYSLALDIESVDEVLGLDILRTNGESVYSIHKFTNKNDEEGYCFISYESEMVVDSWFVIKVPSKSDFQKIKGDKTTLEQIKQLDPATIVFEGNEPSSYHRFSDGTMMEIRYKENDGYMIVKDYGVSKDPANIVKNLLPKDLSLVN